MKIRVTSILFGLMLSMLVACGTETRNTVTLQVAGENSEYDLSNTFCEADILSSGSFSNFPIRCSGQIQSSGNLADTVTFEIYDALFINQNLGQYIPYGPATVTPIVTLNGVPQAYVDGGTIFSQVSDFAGGAVCFRFEIFLASNIFLEGEFCDNIAVGGFGAL